MSDDPISEESKRIETIAFAPTQAKFVRITQTDTTADAPAWSVRNLRIYEAPSAAPRSSHLQQTFQPRLPAKVSLPRISW